MKILAIDTTSKFLSLGIADGLSIYEYNLDLGTRHSRLLMPSIKRVLAALNWQPSDIDYFACGLGPGSFTGLRIGLSAIKAFSWSLHKPIIGLSTLDILAAGVREANASVTVIIDAKRSLVYCAAYQVKNGCLKRIAPYALLNEEELFKKIKNNTIIVGDGISLYKERILQEAKGITILDQDYWYPKAHAMIALAREKIKKKEFTTAFKVKAVYLYPKECQIRK